MLMTSAHWLEEMPAASSIDVYRELARSHALMGGWQGEIVLKFIEHDKLNAICDYEPVYDDPRDTADTLYNVRQALAYFTKLEDLDLGRDPEGAAYRKFVEAERLCKETNDLLRLERSGKLCFRHRHTAGYLYSAKRLIAKVLGRLPHIEELSLQFGPGATRATRKLDASIRRKLTEKVQCSEELFQASSCLLGELPHLVDIHSVVTRVDEDEVQWDRVPVEITPAKLGFVPKNAKTKRSICVEPGLNVLIQLGLGKWIAKRLAAFGVDISTQEPNQELAREGSLTGALATLDLQSASDTISREIVYELLPLDWACFLNSARTRRVALPGGSIMLQEKFSSMGNGFTFPLETLIFWSLAKAVSSPEDTVSVYGDDIIVDVNKATVLKETLADLGFLVNEAKSFVAGPFRESCGKDWYLGNDVRPVYPRGYASGARLFTLHNFYVRRGDSEMAKKVESFIHPALRIYGPDGYGDGHLLGSYQKRLKQSYRDRGFGGHFFDTYVERGRFDYEPLGKGEYVVALYSVYRRGAESLGNFRGRQVPSGGVLKTLLNDVPSIVDNLPLPLREKEACKGVPLPGSIGYKKISIYTFRD